jgi:hypothetical protein
MPAFCPQCGNERSGTLRYCAHCGFDFWKAAQPGVGLEGGPETSAPEAGDVSAAPTAAPPAARHWTGSIVGLLAAGGALIVAPFLPFITATAALVGTLTRSGVELVGAEAFLLCLFGGLLAFTAIQRLNGTAVRRALPIVASLGAGLFTFYYYSQVNERVSSVNSDFGVASIGVGLWLAVAGSVVGFLVGIRNPEAKWLS